MSNQNPYIDEEQTTQWPKERIQKDKQRSTKHTHKTKDRVTRSPLKTGGERRCSEWYAVPVPLVAPVNEERVQKVYDKWNKFVDICNTDLSK